MLYPNGLFADVAVGGGGDNGSGVEVNVGDDNGGGLCGGGGGGKYISNFRLNMR